MLAFMTTRSHFSALKFPDFAHFLPTPFKSVTLATRNALFTSFEFQNFTDTYLGKVTKFQFNCFCLLKNLRGGGAASAPSQSY